MFESSSRCLEELLAQSQLIACRIRAGDTLRQACDGVTAAQNAPPHLKQIWAHSVREIQSGHVGALSSIEAFASLVRLEWITQRKISAKSQLPKIQAAVLTLLGLILVLAAFTMFPTALQPSAFELVSVAGLMTVGAYLVLFLIRRFESKLWLADWSMYLKLMHHQLSEGHTWVSAQSNLAGLPNFNKLPASLKTAIGKLAEQLNRGEVLPRDLNAFDRSRGGRLVIQQLEQLALVAKLLGNGVPVTDLLAHMSQSAQEIFDQEIERESGRLSMLLLIPLFACQAPALMIVIFGPLLRTLS